jgi:ubiquinone/menaquinone biosynthesis C-methylase UbiE
VPYSDNVILNRYSVMSSIRKKIIPHLPYVFYKSALFVYTKLYMRILCRYVELKEAKYSKSSELEYLPPVSLRYRVHGTVDKDIFFNGGKIAAQDIVTLLGKIDMGIDSFNDILDFGCGCGRVLFWLTKYSKKPNYYGTDIDSEAIRWSNNNLGFAKFDTNKALPPLIYKSEMFNLMYAISVFTHLNEEHQFLWLDELRRILKPNGILIVTLHGEKLRKYLPYDVKSKLDTNGFLYLKTANLGHIFPDWYQNAYHTQNYVMSKYENYFKILYYIPGGMKNSQDAVILQKL